MSFQAYAAQLVKDAAFVAPGATAQWWWPLFDNPLNTAIGTLTIVLICLRIFYIIKNKGQDGSNSG